VESDGSRIVAKGVVNLLGQTHFNTRRSFEQRCRLISFFADAFRRGRKEAAFVKFRLTQPLPRRQRQQQYELATLGRLPHSTPLLPRPMTE